MKFKGKLLTFIFSGVCSVQLQAQTASAHDMAVHQEFDKILFVDVCYFAPVNVVKEDISLTHVRDLAKDPGNLENFISYWLMKILGRLNTCPEYKTVPPSIKHAA